MSKKKPTQTLLHCPDCGSTEVTLTHEQEFMANTGEHYCHSVKIQDHDAQARCLKCNWQGERQHLQEKTQ